jgi:polyhydroxybutyrate depolymerase
MHTPLKSSKKPPPSRPSLAMAMSFLLAGHLTCKANNDVAPAAVPAGATAGSTSAPVNDVSEPNSATKERTSDRAPPFVLRPSQAPKAVMLVLHGYGSTGQDHVSMFDLGELRESAAVLVVAPNGLREQKGDKQFWNAVLSCCDFEGRKQDDVRYVIDLADRYAGDLPVYLAGHSNGGAMALRLLCEAPSRWRGVFSLAAPYEERPTCGRLGPSRPNAEPQQPTLVLAHGDSDKVVPFLGGPLLRLHEAQSRERTPAAEAIANFFADRAGHCDAWNEGAPLDLETVRAGAETMVRERRCAQGRIEWWTARGVGHAFYRPTPGWMKQVWQAWHR